MEQKLWIPFTLPSLNEVIEKNRVNRYAGAHLKREIQDGIDTLIMVGRMKPVKAPVEVFILWKEKDRRRDVDNIQSGKKFILDALVEMGILPNDSQKWVKQIHDLVEVDKESPGVLVRLKEE